MSYMHTGHSADANDANDGNDEDLERLLVEGVSLTPPTNSSSPSPLPARRTGDDEEDDEVTLESDVQGAIGLFAEAAQDTATAGLELGLGRHFACVDYCNQAAEKAAQAVSLLRFGRRSMYNHDLRTLGEMVGAPPDVQDDMAQLTPFHPEAFYADTPPEEADDVIDAEQASNYLQCARRVVRWAKRIVLEA
ncbi:MAG TPA: HEPN domain-containing protein [Ktedonobacteraceae bacterium]|nr:HEPN domain-containing protein [Ktedonobacteraceae bacterium]